jgi:hypothetical protein
MNGLSVNGCFHRPDGRFISPGVSFRQGGLPEEQEAQDQSDHDCSQQHGFLPPDLRIKNHLFAGGAVVSIVNREGPEPALCGLHRPDAHNLVHQGRFPLSGLPEHPGAAVAGHYTSLHLSMAERAGHCFHPPLLNRPFPDRETSITSKKVKIHDPVGKISAVIPPKRKKRTAASVPLGNEGTVFFVPVVAVSACI